MSRKRRHGSLILMPCKTSPVLSMVAWSLEGSAQGPTMQLAALCSRSVWELTLHVVVYTDALAVGRSAMAGMAVPEP